MRVVLFPKNRSEKTNLQTAVVIMAAKAQDIDFLECEIDDISLSQICVAMENDQVECDNSIDDASLSQIGDDGRNGQFNH